MSLLAILEPGTGVHKRGAHRSAGLPSIYKRDRSIPMPWWSGPAIGASVLIIGLFAVFFGLDPARWLALGAETPHTQGVVLATSSTPTHTWFGISMQCWDEQHRFVVWYDTAKAGASGWEQAPNADVVLQVQAAPGSAWVTLNTTKDAVGGFIVDERKLTSLQQWITNKKGKRLRLRAADGYTSVPQEIGYNNTCSSPGGDA